MDTIERWCQAADGFTARLDAVTDDQWDAPTTCPEWDVRQLVAHTIGSQKLLPQQFGVDLSGIEDDDPRAEWRAVRAAALAAYEAPGVLDATVKLPFGELTGAQLLNNVSTGDLLIHTWDLARATGSDEQLDPVIAAAVLEGLEPIDEIMRGSAFGPKVEPPPGADASTQLLCFSGRRP